MFGKGRGHVPTQNRPSLSREPPQSNRIATHPYILHTDTASSTWAAPTRAAGGGPSRAAALNPSRHREGRFWGCGAAWPPTLSPAAGAAPGSAPPTQRRRSRALPLRPCSAAWRRLLVLQLVCVCLFGGRCGVAWHGVCPSSRPQSTSNHPIQSPRSCDVVRLRVWAGPHHTQHFTHTPPPTKTRTRVLPLPLGHRVFMDILGIVQQQLRLLGRAGRGGPRRAGG